jgi:hypothetical protein
MSMGDFKVPLTLSTVCGGKLEEEFQHLYPALLSQLKHGDKATINITLEMKRVQDTATMLNLSYKITPRFPAKSKSSVCQITGDNKLRTEEPQVPVKVVNMFEGGKA